MLFGNKGLYFWGSVGCGKTYACYALGRFVWCSNSRQSMKIETFDNILREVRDGFSTKVSEGNILAKYFRCNHLVIDDLAAGSDTGFAERILLAITDYRHNNMLRTSFTSNLPPEKIKDIYGDRVFSRIMGMCEIVRMGGADKRIGAQKR